MFLWVKGRVTWVLQITLAHIAMVLFSIFFSFLFDMQQTYLFTFSIRPSVFSTFISHTHTHHSSLLYLYVMLIHEYMASEFMLDYMLVPFSSVFLYHFKGSFILRFNCVSFVQATLLLQKFEIDCPFGSSQIVGYVYAVYGKKGLSKKKINMFPFAKRLNENNRSVETDFNICSQFLSWTDVGSVLGWYTKYSYIFTYCWVHFVCIISPIW